MKNWIKFLIIIACILIIPYLLSLLIKEEPESKVNNEGAVVNIKKPVDISNWTEYSNEALGFSIKIPPESYGAYRCHPRKTIFVPVKVFEDNINNAVYIAEEYYYEADNYGSDNESECKKTIQSLELFNKEEKEVKARKPFLGWKIIVNNIEDDNDIISFIKDNFGSTCTIFYKDLQTDGSYRIIIKGRDLTENGQSIMNESCFTNFAYRIIYSSEKKKMMSVALGQESTFQTNPEEPSTYQYYEDEMLKSFKFK
ncbi:hypothetical protein M0Q50_08760 [bacterium]|jgi:hypothetical protein|nr:hypothetical protein [bacterium]